MAQLFYYIGANMMNNLLLRKDMCHWSRGMQIRLVYCYTHFDFFHLYGQTGRFTVWVNGSKIRVYCLNKSVPLTEKRPQRCFEEMDSELPF